MAMVFPLGAPLVANMIDYNNPFVLSLILIEIVPPTVPNSVPAFPFSLSCFPDLYTPTITPWLPVGPDFGSFPMVGIPPAWSGKRGWPFVVVCEAWICTLSA